MPDQKKEKYHAFAVTIRPKGGVQDVTQLVAFVRSMYQYYKIVSEMEDDARHLHIAGIAKREATISSHNQKWKRKWKDVFEEDGSIWSVAFCGKIWYNMDWASKYCEKKGASIIEDNLPERANIETYFKDVQTKKNNVASPYYQRLEDLWYQWAPPQMDVTLENVNEFIHDMECISRRIRIIPDPRRRKSTIYALCRYISKVERYAWHGNTDLRDVCVSGM